MNLIRPLLATAALALAGSVGFPPPASRWLLLFAVLAGLLVLYIVIQSGLDRLWYWITEGTTWGRRRDARIRNEAFRRIRTER